MTLRPGPCPKATRAQHLSVARGLPNLILRFTSTEFIKVLAAREIKISMNGKGAWRDNVFVERTLKYEEVYLRAYASVSEARARDRPLPRLLEQPLAAFVA